MAGVQMGLKEIVTAICATQPLRSVVVALARTRGGRRLLTSLSPRRGRYETLEEAWKAAARGRHPGHEHPEAVERHVVLADVPMPSDYAVLYWLERIPGDITLFDFGGNMGNVFYSCAPYIQVERRRLEWIVYDLPEVIEMAKPKAAKRAVPGPRFTTSLQDVAAANVLLVSGTYHYWEKNCRAFLDQFPRLPEHVFINRSPFFKGGQQSIVSMQSTMNFAFPIVIRDEQDLLDGFSEKGYELVDRWKVAEYGHVMPFFPEHSVKSYTGFYFRARRRA